MLSFILLLLHANRLITHMHVLTLNFKYILTKISPLLAHTSMHRHRSHISTSNSTENNSLIIQGELFLWIHNFLEIFLP